MCFSGFSLRSKVQKLRSTYGSIDAAEEALGMTVEHYMDVDVPAVQASSAAPPPPPPQPSWQQPPSAYELLQLIKLMSRPEHNKHLHELVSLVPTADIKYCMSLLFDHLLSRETSAASQVLDEFTAKLLSAEGFTAPETTAVVTSSLQAMKELHTAGHNPYLVGKFGECIVRKRPNSTDSLMPLDRMPFGLIQYQVEFFTARHVSKVIYFDAGH